jgi:hypothetical protein
MREDGGSPATDDGAVDPDLDRGDAEDVGVGELLAHLGLDRGQVRGHRVRTIEIDGDARGGWRDRREFAALDRMGEGGEQDQDRCGDQT